MDELQASDEVLGSASTLSLMEKFKLQQKALMNDLLQETTQQRDLEE